MASHERKTHNANKDSRPGAGESAVVFDAKLFWVVDFAANNCRSF